MQSRAGDHELSVGYANIHDETRSTATRLKLEVR